MVSRVDYSTSMKEGVDATELIDQIKFANEHEEMLTPKDRFEMRQCSHALSSRRFHFTDVIRDAGERYADVTIDNFDCPSDDHKKAVDAVKGYLQASEGGPRRGLLLIGPTGTGKDHLMMSVLRVLIHKWGIECRWNDGQQFFSDVRNAYAENEGESSLLNELSRCRLLAISDPLPAVGRLTDHQMNVFGIVMDRRSRSMLPTIATVNVANRAELYDRLGDRNADRLCEDAVVVPCNWSSYRQRKRPAPIPIGQSQHAVLPQIA